MVSPLLQLCSQSLRREVFKCDPPQVGGVLLRASWLPGTLVGRAAGGRGGPWGRTPTKAPGSPWELVLAGRGCAAHRAQERQGLRRPGAQGSLKAGPCLQGCTKLQRGCRKPLAWHAVLQKHQQLALRKLQILEVLLTLLNSPKTCWGGLGTRAQRSLLGSLSTDGHHGCFFLLYPTGLTCVLGGVQAFSWFSTYQFHLVFAVLRPSYSKTINP